MSKQYSSKLISHIPTIIQIASQPANLLLFIVSRLFPTASLFALAAPSASMVLGEDNPMTSGILQPRPMFTEMKELFVIPKDGMKEEELEWRETARYIGG